MTPWCLLVGMMVTLETKSVDLGNHVSSDGNCYYQASYIITTMKQLDDLIPTLLVAFNKISTKNEQNEQQQLMHLIYYINYGYKRKRW